MVMPFRVVCFGLARAQEQSAPHGSGGKERSGARVDAQLVGSNTPRRSAILSRNASASACVIAVPVQNWVITALEVFPAWTTKFVPSGSITKLVIWSELTGFP